MRICKNSIAHSPFAAQIREKNVSEGKYTTQKIKAVKNRKTALFLFTGKLADSTHY